MEAFSRKRYSDSQQQHQQDEDAYIQDIQKRLTSKATGGIMASSLDRFYTDEVFDLEEKNKLALNRVKSLLVLYSSLFGALVNTSLIYYPSIKLVRKLFKLKGFWNVHFVNQYFSLFDIDIKNKAALPLIMFYNAFTLGAITGAYQAFQTNKLIEEIRSKQTYNVWKI